MDIQENLTNVEQSIPERFEKIAGVHSGRTAIGSDDWQPTYEELNGAVNSLAVVIARRGNPGDRAAILMRHAGPQILAIFAVLKAGRVVVVLNPTDPPARLSQILEDAEPSWLLTDVKNRALAKDIVRENCEVMTVGENLSSLTKDFGGLNLKINPADPACLIYTSGSTGRPKGVVQTHRNLLNITKTLCYGMKVQAQDRILHLASPSGAQGTFNMMCALLNGAALYPFPTMERGVTGLDEWMRTRGITVYVSSSSLFRSFMRTVIGSGQQHPEVRLVRLGSERSTAEDFASFQRHFREDCVLLHTFASSEAGHIARFSLNRNDVLMEKRLPVGRPVEGVEILLLDEAGREVGAGETGTIAIKSRNLSPGYWRNEALTEEKFSDAGPDGLRIFRSGDLGHFTADGLLMHAGREDAQVKVNGYRVELSEVEDALESLAEIEKAVVCANNRANEDVRLVGYLIPRNRDACVTERLREALRTKLPTHMIPTGFVLLEKFPLTPHGKIDRAALRSIEPKINPDRSVAEPETPTEIFLAGIWRQVFGRDAIGRRDNFFDLGGDSLIVATVAAQIFNQRGMELDLRAFVECPTLSELAAKLDATGAAGRVAALSQIERVPRDKPLPLSLQEEQTWKHLRRNPGAAETTTIARSRCIRGPLDAKILSECMDYLARRHEMLRTTFDEAGGQPVHVIRPTTRVPLPQFDFCGLPDAEERTAQLLREDARKPFNLKAGPLIRFTLVRLAAEDHCLLVVSHHLVTDAWSWKLYFRELAILYEAKQRSEPPPLPDFQTIQYVDYAAWQREQWQPGTPKFQESLWWWREFYSAQPRPVKSPFAWKHWLRKLFLKLQWPARLPLKRLWKHRAAKPADGWIWWGVDPAASRRLEEIARQESATFYMVRLAVFTAMLADEAGKPDVALGVYLTQRSRLELQQVFGYFVNHAAVRLRCDLKLTFRQWLAEVRKLTGEIQAHGEIPFELLRENLEKSGVKPIGFRIYFNVAEHTAPAHFGNLEWTRQERIKETMPQAFGITFDQHNEDSRCLASFDARIYDPARVKDFLKRFVRLLEVISQNPDKAIAEMGRNVS